MQSTLKTQTTDQSEIAITLRNAQVGKNLRLIQLEGEPSFCQRLREMGLCESVCLQKVSDGACLICLVCGVRLALSRGLADKIIVTSHSTKMPA